MVWRGEKMKKIKQLFVFVCTYLCVVTIAMSYMDVYAESQSSTVLLPHIHAGSSNSRGGCYTVAKTGTRYEITTQKCQPYWAQVTYDGHVGNCPRCGNATYGQYTFRDRHSCSTQWGSNYYKQKRCSSCGYTDGGGGSLSCGRDYQVSTPKSYTYYDTGCGQTSCGSIYVVSDNSDPAQSITLSYEITQLGSGCTIIDYSWLHNGTVYSSDENPIVEENGDYTCQVTYQDNISNKNGTVSATINISNIDREPPVVESCAIVPEELTNQSVDITITATDSSEISYRIDENEWQSTPVFTVEENGIYQMYVKDQAGNQTMKIVEVTNIDKDGPQISLQMEKDPWYAGNNKILVEAYDENGLADAPYSYDLGNTWTDIAELEITSPGDYSIMVQDVLGNTSEEIIHTEKTALPPTPTPDPTNIPEPSAAPTPTITMMPTSTSAPTPTDKIMVITEPPVTQNIVPAVTVIPTLTPELMPTFTPTLTPEPTNTPVPTAMPGQNPEENKDADKGEAVYIEESQTPTSGFFSVIRYVVNPLAVPVEGGIFLIFGFYLVGTARVYTRSLNGQYIALGRMGKIRKHKEKCYVMCLKKRFVKRAETGQYMMRFSKRFARKHESELLIIKIYHGKDIQTAVAREVTFSIEE